MRCLIPGLLFLAGLPAQASVVRLVAVEDATGNQDQPNVSLGSATELQCGKDYVLSPSFRVWFTRGHLRFDVTPLAGRPAPDRVRLQVYQHRSNAGGCMDVTVHRITTSWSESTLTWQTMPGYDPTAIGTVCVGSSFDSGWKSVDVTQLVRNWIAGTVPNFGLVIRDPTESVAVVARPLYCHSREAAAPGLLPHLEVSYGTLPFGWGCSPYNTVPQLDLLDGEPAIGRSYTVRGAGFIPGQSSLLELIGRSNTTWNGLPLPFPLNAAGFPGCALQVSGQILLTGVADSNGRATLTIPVPPDPSLVGARVYTQIAGIDSNLRLAMTNGFVALLF